MSNKVKLVILDVDGVLTDGKKYYGLDGIPFAKTYCDKDFTAIKRLRGAGVSVCFLSGDERVNKEMANNRRIDFYSARNKNKADFVSKFTLIYGAQPSEMLYVGDDLFDISIMKVVGYSFCPSDSCLDVKNICGNENIIQQRGGNNVVMTLVETLLSRGLVADATMRQIESLDKKEKF